MIIYSQSYCNNFNKTITKRRIIIKKIKKALSIALTSIVAVTGILSVPASAAEYAYPTRLAWKASGYCTPGGSPSNTYTPATPKIRYSVDGHYIYVNGIVNSSDGAKYEIKISCDSGKMTEISTNSNGRYFCKPTMSGAFESVTFRIKALSYTNGNTITANGSAVTIQ